MSLEEAPFIKHIRGVFRQHNSDYDLIIRRLDDPKQRFEELAHFYYFICAPNKEDGAVRSELQLVGVTSLIEAMMSDIDYKDPFQYFDSVHPGENSITDFRAFKTDYHEKYGAAKKVREYFRVYIAEDKDEIQSIGISEWNKNKKKYIPLKKTNDVAVFFYTARSDFVHKAAMRCLLPPNASSAGIKVGKQAYLVTLDMPTFLAMFEKSFVRFWNKKANIC